jgi:hypothetical protein
MYDTTTFLNVDLDISSQEDLAPLAEALRSRMNALHVGRIRRRYWARLSLNTQPKTADIAVRRLISAIDGLSGRPRALWQRAKIRDFNIGIQAADEPAHIEFAIAPTTASLVGRVGGRLVITVYGAGLVKARA